MRLPFAAAAAMLMVAGCGGGGYINGPGITPCLYNGLSQLIYPIPGATGVPDTPQQIVFATSRLFPSSFDVLISTDPDPNHAQSGTAAFFQRIQASQIPSPSAAVTISNALYESAPTGASFPHATYYVFLNDALYSCTPVLAGSFTTQ